MPDEIKHLGDLIPDPSNARSHTSRGVGMIEEALNEIGAARSIVIDEAGRILAGNATVEAAAAAGIERVRVVDADGEEIIAVRRTGLSDEQKKRLALYDNRAGELSDWDAGVLADLKAQDKELLAGLFRDDELEEILGDLMNDSPEDPGAQIDRAAELQEKWQVERGQVWQIGRHRLVCGDSVKCEVEATNLIFDPPWDIKATLPVGDWDNVIAFCDGARLGDIVNLLGSPTWVFTWDCVTSWFTPNRPLRRAKYAAWYGDITQFRFNGAHYGDAGDERKVSNTRGEYQFIPDSRGKHLSDVYQEPLARLHSAGWHNHEKPIDWMRLLVGDCLGELVYDPFCGSGTTLVACEQTGRIGYGMEIEPKYCAVTLERLTGLGLDAYVIQVSTVGV